MKTFFTTALPIFVFVLGLSGLLKIIPLENPFSAAPAPSPPAIVQPMPDNNPVTESSDPPSTESTINDPATLTPDSEAQQQSNVENLAPPVVNAPPAQPVVPGGTPPVGNKPVVPPPIIEEATPLVALDVEADLPLLPELEVELDLDVPALLTNK